MVRKVIDIILTINLVLLVSYIAYLWFAGVLVIDFQAEPQVVEVEQTIHDVFRVTLQQEVVRRLGQPVEGFEPHMFLTTFPGLAASDFDNVEASIGVYEIVNGQLIHKPATDQLIHSAAAAVSRRGMRTLLDNVAARLEIDLNQDGTITEIMRAISTS